MNVSPVLFAREFERLKARLAANVADDTKLVYLIDFWQQFGTVLDRVQFETYRVETRQMMESLISSASIKDLPPETLLELMRLTDSLKLTVQSEVITFRIAQVHCYVGEFDEAVRLLRQRRGLDGPQGPDSDSEPLRDREGLEIFCQRLRQTDSSVCGELEKILIEWTDTAEGLKHDRVYSLFVDADGEAGGHGRLRALRSGVELSGKAAVSDEITFENQIKTPDDPFVGSAYNAFEALREFFMVHGYKDKGSRYFHAHFNIVDSNQTFTGDSIGLSVAAVTFAGLMRTEVRRQERFVSQEVAFTGGVDDTGRITPVNEETLRQKINRVFFSHIRYLVISKENLRAAGSILREFTERYPHRTLHLVAYERLADVLGDKNLIRSEKVCIGEFVARKAVHYTRVTRMQVPILLALAYLLFCLVYPRAWVGFDDNPRYVHPTRTGFMALNADSTTLWEKEYACDTLDCQRWIVEDLDRDGKNEVAVLPHSNAACDCSSMLYVYNSRGDSLFSGDAVIVHQYAADSTRYQTYNSHELKSIRYSDETIILTSLTSSNPGRTHIKFWNASGANKGWYVNAGSTSSWLKMNSLGQCEKIVFYGINNPMGSASMFTLPRDSTFGTSPPYKYPGFDISGARWGNQLRYMVIPPSDYCRKLRNQYNGVSEIKLSGPDLLEVLVEENVDGAEPLTYYVNADLRVVRAERRDPFMRARERLVDEGKLPPMLDTADYFAKLRDSVKYWTDSGWVTEAQLRAAENGN